MKLILIFSTKGEKNKVEIRKKKKNFFFCIYKFIVENFLSTTENDKHNDSHKR